MNGKFVFIQLTVYEVVKKKYIYFNLSHTLSLSLFLSHSLSFLCVSFHIFYLMKLDDVIVAICNKVKKGSLFCAISGHALQRSE